MKYLTQLSLTAIAAIGLAACSADSGDKAETMDHASEAMDHSKMDHEKMDHSDMTKTAMSGDTGHSTGVIFSISPDGKMATIDHQAIEGVGMDAMTMGFGATSAVDLAKFSKGDNVSFMVKKGRDNSYRITAMCNTDTDGKDCLDSMMGHSGH